MYTEAALFVELLGNIIRCNTYCMKYVSLCIPSSTGMRISVFIFVDVLSAWVRWTAVIL